MSDMGVRLYAAELLKRQAYERLTAAKVELDAALTAVEEASRAVLDVANAAAQEQARENVRPEEKAT